MLLNGNEVKKATFMSKIDADTKKYMRHCVKHNEPPVNKARRRSIIDFLSSKTKKNDR